MGLQENKAIVAEAFAAMNRRDIDGFLSHYSTELVLRPTRRSAEPEVVPPDAHRAAVEWWIGGFPDLHMAILEQIAEGDRVLTRFLSSGTHQYEWFGDPTGRKVEFEEWHVVRIEDSLIAEETGLIDELVLFSRIGAIEVPWLQHDGA